MAAVLVLADQISLEAVDVEVVSTLDRDTAITHKYDALLSPRRMVQGRKVRYRCVRVRNRVSRGSIFLATWEDARMSLQDPSNPLSAPPPEPQTPKPPVSESKILANRKNSLRSTGPKTLHGKRNVSRNAMKHGIFAREVVITAGDGRRESGRVSCFGRRPGELLPTCWKNGGNAG
jgi:hypothetical protein